MLGIVSIIDPLFTADLRALHAMTVSNAVLADALLSTVKESLLGKHVQVQVIVSHRQNVYTMHKIKRLLRSRSALL